VQIYTCLQGGLTILTSPLSQQQKTIWQLLSQGLSVSSVAKKLKTTRQYVNQTRQTAEAKLSLTLLGVAQVNDIQITKVDAKQGVLLGYHPALNRKAVITYSSNFGVKVWFWNDNPEEVTNQEFLKQTKNYLIDLAKERGIEIGEASSCHPAKLANFVFSRLLPAEME
jgi:DNA-binding CsgD family transcriptional regulator